MISSATGTRTKRLFIIAAVMATGIMVMAHAGHPDKDTGPSDHQKETLAAAGAELEPGGGEAYEYGPTQVASLGRTVKFIGQFHPVAVHFPIALILTAALAEALALLIKKPWFEDTARFLVAVAALGALAAVVLGLFAEKSSGFSGEYSRVVEIHEALGISTAITAVITAALSELGRSRQSRIILLGYRIALFACVVLVGLTGYFGGELVHGIGHYTW